MKAWQVIEKPEKWTQGVMYRTPDGKETHEYKPEYKCCAYGAIRVVYGDESENDVAANIVRRLWTATGIDSIGIWNDKNNHSEVVAKLKELDI